MSSGNISGTIGTIVDVQFPRKECGMKDSPRRIHQADLLARGCRQVEAEIDD